jgi:hypothetical protein
MKKKKNVPAPVISSADEAEKAANDWIVLHHSADDLLALVRKIWEDAYQSGRSDARSDAAVEAAEAEWFNG